MLAINTAKEWLAYVSKNVPEKIQGAHKVGIKGASPRIEYWTDDQYKKYGLEEAPVNESLYLISGMNNGKEELLSIPVSVWRIYDELSNFYNTTVPEKNILRFVEDRFQMCKEVSSIISEAQNEMFENVKLGQHVDYSELITTLTSSIHPVNLEDGALKLVNSMLEAGAKLEGVQKTVSDVLVVEGLVLSQSSQTIRVMLMIATKLQDMADAKKSYGILDYRKDLKTKKDVLNEQSKVGRLLNHYIKLYDDIRVTL